MSDQLHSAWDAINWYIIAKNTYGKCVIKWNSVRFRKVNKLTKWDLLGRTTLDGGGWEKQVFPEVLLKPILPGGDAQSEAVSGAATFYDTLQTGSSPSWAQVHTLPWFLLSFIWVQTINPLPAWDRESIFLLYDNSLKYNTLSNIELVLKWILMW